jgi:DNA modification methylase
MNCINQVVHEKYTAIHGDCVEALKGLPDHCIGYSIFSPPFASLYTYSNSPRDMGNVRNDAEFFEHFDYLIAELRRVMQPGRNISFHCMDLPSSKERDGVIGLKDFPGELLRAFQRQGFTFHAKATIWKDPVTAMTRTKALGLLHKSIRERSEMCRMGIPDYLITVRAPGECAEHVTHTAEDFPVSLWQQYASPIWMDINPSDTLQYMSAREHDDEKHICPLQLEVIRRGIRLWTNPGDIVLSPFMGIGSEGYVSLEMGRKFVGVELKASYFQQAAKNLAGALANRSQDLFSEVA